MCKTEGLDDDDDDGGGVGGMGREYSLECYVIHHKISGNSDD